MTDARPIHQRPLHLLALLMTAATFPLIFMGGLVTTHAAGMAVPDWPNSFGYNMFTFPPSQWIGGIWYEHVHRLNGTVVGFLAILVALHAWGPARSLRVRRNALIVACAFAAITLATVVCLFIATTQSWIGHDGGKLMQHFVVGFASVAAISTATWSARRREDRRWVRWLCVIALVAVCVQGVFGGLRVELINLTLAIIHGCFAQAFFCLAAAVCVVTSRWWETAVDCGAGASQLRGLWRSAGFAGLLIFLQLVVGATMRHHGAGLAIPDLPLAYGKLVPPASAAGLDVVNQFRAWSLHEKPVTLWQVWLHFGHRLGAVVVTLALVAVVYSFARRKLLPWSTVIVAGLLAVQFTLGVLTVLWKKPADIASAHVAVGALLLMSTAVLTIRAARLYFCSNRVPQLALQRPAASVADQLPGVTPAAAQLR